MVTQRQAGFDLSDAQTSMATIYNPTGEVPNLINLRDERRKKTGKYDSVMFILDCFFLSFFQL